MAYFEEGGSVLKRLPSIGRPLHSELASPRNELQQPPKRARAEAECCSVKLFQARSVCLQLPFKSLHRTFLAVNFSPNESLKYFHILHFHHNSCTFSYLPYVLNFHFVLRRIFHIKAHILLYFLHSLLFLIAMSQLGSVIR